MSLTIIFFSHPLFLFKVIILQARLEAYEESFEMLEAGLAKMKARMEEMWKYFTLCVVGLGFFLISTCLVFAIRIRNIRK